MTAGRPQEYDRVKVGEEMVEWAKNNPSALTVPMFATMKGLHSGILRRWCVDCEKFRALYMQAKEIIGINRLAATMQGNFESSIYRAHVGNYDVDINEYMREEKKYDSDLRKQEEGAKSQTVNLMVPNELAAGLNLPASPISNTDNTSAK